MFVAVVLLAAFWIFAAYSAIRSMWQWIQRSRPALTENWGETEMPPGHPERESVGLDGYELDALLELEARTWGGST